MIGTRLGSWILETEIGRGGMGTVYRARRAANASEGPATAAVKILAAELAVEVGFRQRFQREIAILQQLDHEVIVAFYESGVEGDRYWYAMEYIDGASYEEIREEEGRLPWREVLELAWQLAPALKHAHDRGVIHRDIKPSNLLRVEDEADPEGPGRVKLTDFGIASLFASPHLTVTGGVIGTPEYLSPEQAAGKPVTKRSDLYSLGIVLYALTTGDPPFEGEPIDLLHKHRFGQFDRPRRIVPDMHPDFDEIICDLLAKEPGDRPGDAGVLFRRLDSLRRKLARQEEAPPTQSAGATRGFPEGTGPATMVSQFVRAELEAQNRGGPIKRFLDHPVVVVTLFVLCLTTLVWTFWPANPETLFRRGAKLMESSDPGDWEQAWTRYLEPLKTKFPDHAHREEVDAFERQIEEARAEAGDDPDRPHRPMSEARWFYERALRCRRRGEDAEARRLLEALIDAYRDLPSQRRWVRLAEQELDLRPPLRRAPRTAPVLREALDRARLLEKEGKADAAKAIRAGLKELYRDDEAAKEVIGKE
jgi:hypothetical protein